MDNKMDERIRFPLSSLECELLAAFEVAPMLTDLARLMRKDPSVISRDSKHWPSLASWKKMAIVGCLLR